MSGAGESNAPVLWMALAFAFGGLTEAMVAEEARALGIEPTAKLNGIGRARGEELRAACRERCRRERGQADGQRQVETTPPQRHLDRTMERPMDGDGQPQPNHTPPQRAILADHVAIETTGGNEGGR